jgi:hypothetical protein
MVCPVCSRHGAGKIRGACGIPDMGEIRGTETCSDCSGVGEVSSVIRVHGGIAIRNGVVLISCQRAPWNGRDDTEEGAEEDEMREEESRDYHL